MCRSSGSGSALLFKFKSLSQLSIVNFVNPIVKRKKNKFICTFSFASVICAYTSCTIMFIIWRMKSKDTTCINTFLYTRYVPAESAFCVCELSVSVCVPLFFQPVGVCGGSPRSCVVEFYPRYDSSVPSSFSIAVCFCCTRYSLPLSPVCSIAYVFLPCSAFFYVKTYTKCHACYQRS